MPTPFYHLCLAQDLITHSDLLTQVKEFLNQNQSAFFLGKTAPDVQVISGQTREDTHFYNIPVLRIIPAWERILDVYPSLADPASIARDRAAFLAGYLCHLQADQHWAVDIFNPVFGPRQAWGTFHERLYLHNVLRAYLDQQALPCLPSGIGHLLQKSGISHWLPFVTDDHLKNWRNYLAEQLMPGAWIATVEVFAKRQGLSPEAFYQVINSEERMGKEVFSHLPQKTLENYRQKVISQNITLLHSYLNGFLSKG